MVGLVRFTVRYSGRMLILLEREATVMTSIYCKDYLFVQSERIFLPVNQNFSIFPLVTQAFTLASMCYLKHAQQTVNMRKVLC